MGRLLNTEKAELKLPNDYELHLKKGLQPSEKMIRAVSALADSSDGKLAYVLIGEQSFYVCEVSFSNDEDRMVLNAEDAMEEIFYNAPHFNTVPLKNGQNGMLMILNGSLWHLILKDEMETDEKGNPNPRAIFLAQNALKQVCENEDILGLLKRKQ